MTAAPDDNADVMSASATTATPNMVVVAPSRWSTQLFDFSVEKITTRIRNCYASITEL